MRALEAAGSSLVTAPLRQCISLQATKLRVLASIPHGSSMMRGSTVRIEVADGQQLACAHLDTRPAPARRLETVRDAEDGGFSWNFSTASSDLPSSPQSCIALATAASEYRTKGSMFSRRVPENMAGSCGTMLSWLRRASKSADCRSMRQRQAPNAASSHQTRAAQAANRHTNMLRPLRTMAPSQG